jgi:DNA mismatch repair protein MutS2
MLLYPEKILEKLEFDQICERLAALCVSEEAAEKALSLQPVSDAHTIHSQLELAWEMYQLSQFDTPLPDSSIPRITRFLQLARIEGSFFDESQCAELIIILSLSKRLISFFASRKEQYPHLYALTREVSPAAAALQLLEIVFSKDGKMKPNASKELASITADLQRKQAETRKKLELLFREARQQGWAAETGPTLRDGRLVLPILAEYKRKIKGFIHDESATGQTVYLEPAELLEHNNDIRNLELAQKREIRRILIQLTSDLSPYLGEMAACHELTATIDFLRAGATLAGRYPLVSRPAFTTSPGISWKSAYHPLLWFHHRAQNKKVVPLDISLTDQQTILVVSGPNAGGKSVGLKTIGLLQTMLQAGLLIPVAEGSKWGLFERIMVDLGDEQSIENDLSTYSSHLTNMRFFTENTHPKSLFLIDEFGTGTDPALGGPIAEAILEKLHDSGAFGVVNTHYSNLKILAGRLKGIVNGAMGFDTQTLEPRYRLEIGKPGSSFAFEIASKIGLDDKIMAAAREKMGVKQQDMESLLIQLEQEKAEIERFKRLTLEKDRLLEELLARTEQKEAELKQQKRRILEQAREEAAQLLAHANREIEQTIRLIKESAADKEITQKARASLQEVQKKVQKTNSVTQTLETTNKLVVGGYAKIRDSQSIGTIVSLGKKEAVLALGELRLTIQPNRLEAVSAADARRQQRAASSNVQLIAETIGQFSPKLDLRGFRTLDALQELDRFLDKAMMAGYNRLEILHGKGDGILRKMLRDHLKKQRFVASFESEHPDRGGDGITLVSLH